MCVCVCVCVNFSNAFCLRLTFYLLRMTCLNSILSVIPSHSVVSKHGASDVHRNHKAY